MEENNNNLKANNFVFNTFLILFSLFYAGMIFKIFLPSKIQEKQAALFWPKSQGMVAGVSTITEKNNFGLIPSFWQIGENFVRNVTDSVDF